MSIEKIQLNQWYREHHRWLMNWLRQRLNNEQDAEDLSHDTFLRALKSHCFSDVEQPRRYLMTIAKGLSIDLFRRQTLETQYYEALASQPESHQISEEQQALILETLIQVDTMLDGLGVKVKQTFILSQIEGLNYREIAEKLDISVRTVNNYMAKAVEHCCLYQMQLEDEQTP